MIENHDKKDLRKSGSDGSSNDEPIIRIYGREPIYKSRVNYLLNNSK